MTNAELIARIKAEVEPVEWYVEALLSFLSTLELEKPMNPEEVNELEKESDKLSDELFCEFFPEDGDMITPSDFRVGLRKFARHFYELGCRRTAEKYDEIEYNRQRAEGCVPNDLEEAAVEYSKEVSDGHNYRDLRVGFIAGAKWQKEQDEKEQAECSGYIFRTVKEDEK